MKRCFFRILDFQGSKTCCIAADYCDFKKFHEFRVTLYSKSVMCLEEACSMDDGSKDPVL